MSSGLIGKKIGMTSVFDEAGNNVPCTVIEAGPNVVTHVKRTDGDDGYDAVQLAYGERKEKHTTSAMRGHFEAAGTEPKKTLSEFRDFNAAFDEPVVLGDRVNIADLFQEGELVNVAGITKGKGFQGVVKRHGFGGVGMKTHGQSDVERAPGSIGASSDPSRVFPGMRMGGRMGGERATIKNLRVVRILPDNNVILIQGSVPGHKNSYVEIYKQRP